MISNNFENSVKLATPNPKDGNMAAENKTAPVSTSAPQKANTTNSDEVTLNNHLSESETVTIKPEIAATLKKYGVVLTSENLKLIAAMGKNSPSLLKNGDLLGLMLARKVDGAAALLAEKYADKSLNFSSLFANLSEETMTALKESWNTGKVLEKLKELVSAAKDFPQNKENLKLAEDVVDNLKMQEIFSILPEPREDGSIYFQWPIFWEGQETPDCLEGEAFVPFDKEQKDSFCLRILVNPPNLGQIEVALTTNKKNLFVYFGVDEELKEIFKSSFGVIRERILAEGNFVSVQFNVGTAKLHKNFFSSEERSNRARQTSSIDFKA